MSVVALRAGYVQIEVQVMMCKGNDDSEVFVLPTLALITVLAPGQAVTERTVLTGPTGFASRKPNQERIYKVRRLTSGDVNVLKE